MRIFKFAETHPERLLAVTDTGETCVYGDIGDAARLLSGTVGRGLLFLLCENTPGSLLAYLGALRGEAVPLLLDAALPAELLRNLLDIYQPAFCAAPAARLAELKRQLPAAAIRGVLRDFVLLETGWHGPAVGKDFLKLLLTTSGSTGSPKLVRISGENLDANAASIAEYLEIDENERPITSLPMYYSYGMSVINSHVLKGAALLLTERTVLERAFWEFADREGATSFAGVPYTYEMLDRLRITGVMPAALRTLTQAGGKLSPELHQKFAEWCRAAGRKFVVMYGQTEASPRMGYLPAEVSLEKCGSMGIAIPGGTLRLVDDAGNEIKAAGETGELVYEGANVCLGYAETPSDLLRGDENRGVLRTGDMAYRDADGYFFITGRKRRFIKVLGRRVNLDETERVLRARFSLELACTGEDDRLLVWLHTRDADMAQAVSAYLADTVGIPTKLAETRTVDQIPKSAAGKTLYGELIPKNGPADQC